MQPNSRSRRGAGHERRSAPAPPTSWCGGMRATTPRRTRRSGRSSPPSSRRPASRSSWSSIQRRSIRRRSRRRWRPASRPTSPSASCSPNYIAQWAFDDRLVDLSDAVGHFADLFDPDVLDWVTLAQRKHRPRGPVRAADGPYDQPRPRLEEPPGAGGLHARGHSEGVGRFLVVLVRPGAAGGAQGTRPRRHLGRRAAHVGRAGHPERVLPVPGCL